MYFVDQEQLEQRLLYIERMSQFLGGQKSPETVKDQLACERAIHTSIEAILDVGNQMIDGFIMRDPGSYADIIEILNDEQVLSDDEAKDLVQYVLLRKFLVADYTTFPMKNAWEVYKQIHESLVRFPDRIREYLADQLGPVSAFKPKSHR